MMLLLLFVFGLAILLGCALSLCLQAKYALAPAFASRVKHRSGRHIVPGSMYGQSYLGSRVLDSSVIRNRLNHHRSNFFNLDPHHLTSSIGSAVNLLRLNKSKGVSDDCADRNHVFGGRR